MYLQTLFHVSQKVVKMMFIISYLVYSINYIVNNNNKAWRHNAHARHIDNN